MRQIITPGTFESSYIIAEMTFRCVHLMAGQPRTLLEDSTSLYVKIPESPNTFDVYTRMKTKDIYGCRNVLTNIIKIPNTYTITVLGIEFKA